MEAIEIYTYVRSKIDEIKEEYWSELDIILAINESVEKVWDFVADISEEMFLKEGTITVSSGTRECDQPARSRYISNFCGVLHKHDNPETDYRPEWVSSGKKLTLRDDYFIGGSTGDKFVLKTIPNSNDTINVWYKAIPARISKPDATIELPDILWIPVTNIAVLHCRLKDENYDDNISMLIQDSLRLARSQLIKAQGYQYKFRL